MALPPAGGSRATPSPRAPASGRTPAASAASPGVARAPAESQAPRTRGAARAPADQGTLWLLGDLQPPLPSVIEAFVARHGRARTLVWLASPAPEWATSRRSSERRAAGRRRHGRVIVLRRAGNSREYPVTVTWVSPRLLVSLLRAPEDVVVVQELNLTALFAVLSKLRRGRRVVALAEGDLGLLGATGRARIKVWFRRAVARWVDAFVANGSGATRYLSDTLGVRGDRIVEGWWLAGLAPPEGEQADGLAVAPGAPGPFFLAAGQLIPRKGIDLLLDAIGRYRREVGPCTLWIVGEGPQRPALERQARELGVHGSVDFLGQVDRAALRALLRAADLLVFPTLHDLVGRVVVEALSVGTPVAVSVLSGAAGTIVAHGDNGLLMDPRDPDDLLSILRRAADPAVLDHLRAGAERTAAELTPAAAAAVVAEGIALARRPR